MTLLKQFNNYFNGRQLTETKEIGKQVCILTISLLYSLSSDTSINLVARWGAWLTNSQNSNNELYYVPARHEDIFFVSARNLPARAQNLIVSTTKQRAAQLTIAPRLRINVRRTIEIHCNPKNLSPHTTSHARARARIRLSAPVKFQLTILRKRSSATFPAQYGHKSPSK